jgi:hypothetical protein
MLMMPSLDERRDLKRVMKTKQRRTCRTNNRIWSCARKHNMTQLVLEKCVEKALTSGVPPRGDNIVGGFDELTPGDGIGGSY